MKLTCGQIIPIQQGKCYTESYAGSWMEELSWSEGRSWHPESFTTLNGAEQNKQKNKVLLERVQLTV